MKALLVLIIILFAYYQVYYRFPEYLSTKTHIYLGVFTVGYLVIYYILNYQRGFAFKLFNHMHEVDNKPLYDFDGRYYKQNQMEILKNNLAIKQGWRCINCQNPILQKDFDTYKMDYIKPLKYGGANSIDNIGVSCSTCNAFKPY